MIAITLSPKQNYLLSFFFFTLTNNHHHFMAQSLYASQQCLTLDKGFEQMNRGEWSLQGFLLKPSTSVTPGHYSFAPPCHGTFNICGQGIGVDNKVGEVGCPGREGESVRINKESNDMEINFSWLVFLALLAVIMRMKKDSWSKRKKEKKVSNAMNSENPASGQRRSTGQALWPTVIP